MSEKNQTSDIPLEHSVKPRAWARISNISGRMSGVFQAGDDGSAPAVELKTESMVPMILAPSGWCFTRDHSNRIVIKMPNGGGCVVGKVASDERLIPEEVLFALCEALGA